MNYPQFLTKCIGEEIRYIFANSMEVNLEKRIAICNGSLLKNNQKVSGNTDVKVVFGGGLIDGFFISSYFISNQYGTYELKLKLSPFELNYDRKVPRSRLLFLYSPSDFENTFPGFLSYTYRIL